MFYVDLNSDLGESFGNYTIGMDEEILQYVSSANRESSMFEQVLVSMLGMDTSDDERDAMTKLREADTRDYREKVNRYKATY